MDVCLHHSTYWNQTMRQMTDSPCKLWAGWGPRQVLWGGVGQWLGIQLQMQAFVTALQTLPATATFKFTLKAQTLLATATLKFTLKAGGKKGTSLVMSLPMLMDPKYKCQMACPELQRLPKNLYTFITNRNTRCLHQACQ